MKFPTRTLIAFLMAGATIPAQPAPLAEIGRVFVQSATTLAAINLDGTIAWTNIFTGAGPAEVPLGIALDPGGYLWQSSTAAVVGYPNVVRRFTTAGALLMTVPLPDPYLSLLTSPAVDRQGDCYVARTVSAPGTPMGVVHRITKISPTGNFIWDLDVTSQVAMSPSPIGIGTDVKVDEDGGIWTAFGSNPNVLGGRLIRVSSIGQILLSVQAQGNSIQMNPNRTVRYVQGGDLVCPTDCAHTVAYDGTVLHQQPSFLPFPGHFLAHASNLIFWHSVMSSVHGIIPFGTTPPAPHGYQPLFIGIGLPMSYRPVGVFLDVEGRLWSSSQYYSGLGAILSAVRHDPPLANGAYPVSSETAFGTPSYFNQGAINWGNYNTAYNWCLVIDPWGDLDGDGVLNRNEIMEGTNPCDPASASTALSISGLGIGQTATFALSAPGQAQAGYLSALDGPASLLRLPDHRGFGPSPFLALPQWWLSAGNAFVSGAAGSLDGSGMASASVQVPNDPALAGAWIRFGFATFDPTWSLGIRSLFGPVSCQIGGCGP